MTKLTNDNKTRVSEKQRKLCTVKTSQNTHEPRSLQTTFNYYPNDSRKRSTSTIAPMLDPTKDLEGSRNGGLQPCCHQALPSLPHKSCDKKGEGSCSRLPQRPVSVADAPANPPCSDTSAAAWYPSSLSSSTSAASVRDRSA